MISGIMTAVLTPLTSDGEVNRELFERFLVEQFRQGVDGVYLGGSTAQGLSLTAEKREELVEAALGVAGKDNAVVVHIGSHKREEVFRLSSHAAKVGATAISSLPPMDVTTEKELYDYYRELAARSELPVILYHFPAYSHVVKSLAQLEDLCALPNVAGVKFTDFNLFWMDRLIAGGTRVYNGYDEVLVPGLLLGCAGAIGSTYNVVLEDVLKLKKYASESRWLEARQVQGRINDFIEICKDYPWHAALKSCLRWRGMDFGPALGQKAFLTLSEEETLTKRISNRFPELLEH